MSKGLSSEVKIMAYLESEKCVVHTLPGLKRKDIMVALAFTSQLIKLKRIAKLAAWRLLLVRCAKAQRWLGVATPIIAFEELNTKKREEW